MPDNLVALLRRRAEERPASGYTFLSQGALGETTLSYAELDGRARGVASVLRQVVPAGERVLLLCPPGLDFIAAFFGCLYAGCIAVPAYPPRSSDRSQLRLRAIAGDAAPRAVIVSAAAPSGWSEHVPELAGVTWLAMEDLVAAQGEPGLLPEPAPETVAFLQYTSGSTSTPKGVRVTHANLLHNERLIREAFGQDESSVVVGWLPLYHDMGLIGNVLQPLYAGARCVLMSPAAFLQRPLRWLQAISDYRGTTSGGPDFAYDLCVRKVRAVDLPALDLSCWRVAFNGAEPVRAETLERFAEAFAPCGFRRAAFFPCYGLAEATLFVSGGTVGEEPRVAALAAAALERHEVRPVLPGADAGGQRRLVSCGRTGGGQRLVIADPETGAEQAAGRVGEVWVSGPSVAAGYWNRPEESARDFAASLASGEGPFLRTGDLGFLDGGELFVTGRLKDLIILRGRNHYPQDIERTAEASHADLQPGCGAAFAVESAGEERLVAVLEVTRRHGDLAAVAEAVRRAVAEEHEVRVHEVVLVGGGGVPRTSSGKVQRRACRAAYLAASLPALHRSALAAPAAGATRLAGDGLAELEPEEWPAAVEACLRSEISRRAGVPGESLDMALSLASLGLDSLAVHELKAALEADFGLSVPEPTLLEVPAAELRDRLVARLSTRRSGEEPVGGEELPLLPAGESLGEHPLSHGQEAVLLLEGLNPAAGVHNLSAAARVETIDGGALRRAFDRLVERHAALRTTFHAPLGEPRQVVHARLAPEWLARDVSGLAEPELRDLLRREAGRPFDLAAGPLLRAGLFQRPDHCVLLLVAHHLICDFWSVAVLLDEWARLYRQETTGAPAGLPPLSHTHAGFALWQRQRLAGERGEHLWDHWRGRLDAAAPALDLAGDRPRPPMPDFQGATARLALDPGLTTRLKALARGFQTTPYAVLLAAFQALLGSRSGQERFVVGAPAAGRVAPGLERVVGFFANPLPLRADLRGNPSFAELVGRVRETLAAALAHQDAPFAWLTGRLQPVRDPSRPPVFQVSMVLQRAPAGLAAGLAGLALGHAGVRVELPGLTLESLTGERGVSQLDLMLALSEWAAAGGAETGARLLLTCEYATALFDAATVARLLESLRVLLAGVVDDPGLPLDALPCLTASECQALLHEWNDTGAAPAADCVHRLFRRQAELTPEALALACEDEQVTYRELGRRARELAARLRRLGVMPDALVGLCTERSPEMVTGLLGILEAGGAYVPLDPAYPRERLAFMLEDSGAEVLVTQRRLRGLLPAFSGRVVELEDAPWGAEPSLRPVDSAAVTAGHLAYVIYTSGSTGRPKGVQVPHGALTNFLLAMGERPGIGGGDYLLSVTSLSFDIAALEIYLPLITGGTLEVAGRDVTLDGGRLRRRLAESGATVMQATPATWRLLLDAGWEGAGGLRALCGGEALPPDLAARLGGRAASLWNLYGPTETTVWSMVAAVDPAADGAPTLGRPIAATRVLLLDRGRPVPVGVPGELVIGGAGLARGYRGRPELSAERFVPDGWSGEPGARLYRTGDLARHLPDGEIEFLGRIDHQVKVRGFRIELGEIEATLARHPAVSRCVVTVRHDLPEGTGIAAYIVAANVVAGGGAPAAAELRAFLRESLPDYMLPSAWAFLSALPLTPNGKVDRRALPAPDRSRAARGGGAGPAGEALPRTAMERAIAEVWREVLAVERVGLNDNFFDLGGHSLLLSRVQERLRQALGRDLGLVDLFRHPTVRSLARHLAPGAEEAAPAAVAAPELRPAGEGVAIIGMSGRFPGAPDVETLWRNLCDGVESISRFTDEELLAAGVDPALLADSRYVRAAGALEGMDEFDAAFFGFNPREAEIMDPQHRVFLECAWAALEDAGYDSERYPRPVGVYAGMGMNTYLLRVLSGMGVSPDAVDYQVMIGNDKDFVPTRVAYKLNLKGPSVLVQTACSTSLVAVHLACQALLRGECDMALAGGVSLAVPPRTGYLYQEGGVLSPDGRCRAFDAEARGTVRGSGAGIVVLKRLADALADGDTIRAVIKGSALNNDGSEKVGYTAPSVDGQARVIAAALDAAGVAADTVGYVETHGTGTRLGDPIEIAALTQAFRAGAGGRQLCAIGSVKTNLGHLDTAAGVTGLIKAALAVERGAIPPSLHFSRPNPEIDFAATPFYVNAALSAWAPAGTPRRAGVSSFGIGGTNAHAVLEQAPAAVPTAPSGDSRPLQLLVLSARTAAALEAATDRLARHLRQHPELPLADVAFTLQAGRRPLAHRRTVVARDSEDAAAALETRDPARVLTGQAEGAERPVVFLFPGGGAQYAGMAAGLYATEPVFRRELDLCLERLQPHLTHLQGDLRSCLFPAPAALETAAARLERTSWALPALFAVEYALAKLWISWGVRPRAMIGHSLGEYAAACLAGVLSLDDALALVALRGRLFDTLPEGAMLSVPLPEAEVVPRLGPELSIAAVNGPGFCVASGPVAAIEEARQAFAGRGVDARRLHISVAAHSPMVEPILREFGDFVARLELAEPRIPYVSNVTGTWITAADATDPGYWVRHLRQTVRFADGVRELLADGTGLFLEVGPGQTLSTLVRQHPDRQAAQAVLASMRHARESRDDLAVALDILGRLWRSGVEVDWVGLHAGERRRRVPLPTYPFERRRFWIEAAPLTPAAQVREPADLADWFHVPVWKRAKPAAGLPGEPAGGCWLVLVDDLRLGAHLARRLEEGGAAVVTVTPAPGGAEPCIRLGESAYQIDPRRDDGYAELFADLRRQGRRPDRVVHLWALDRPEGGGEEEPRALPRTLDIALDRGFHSLLALARELGRDGAPAHLAVVSSGLREVTGEEELRPLAALVAGACQAIPREYPSLSCRSIDLAGPVPPHQVAKTVDALLRELDGGAAEPLVPIVALRGVHRWVPTFEPVRLAGGEAVPLRDEGVYLITGGLGGLGLALAGHLARRRARLVLVGRSGLPGRETWDSRVADLPQEGRVRRAILRVRELEALGAQVLVLAADVADPDRMRAAWALARRRFGPIDGVFHAAGVLGAGLIETKTRQAAREVLAPKVAGTLVLAELAREEGSAFLLLFSSVSAALSQVGQSDYAAANAFLDAFALAASVRGGVRTVAVGWPAWREVGLAAETTVPVELAAWREENLRRGISTAQGLEALERALAAGLPHVVVSRQGFQDWVEESWAARPLADLAELEPAAGARPAHARPDLGTPYVAPRDAVEQRLAALWEELLGIGGVGVHDDFLELGGHSLLATRLMTRLREAFGVELPLRALFDAPTVAGLAAAIARAIEAAGGTAMAVAEPAMPPLVPDGARAHEPFPLTDVQQAYWLGRSAELELGNVATHAYLEIESGDLALPRLETAWRRLVERHGMLRAVVLPEGRQRILERVPPYGIAVLDLAGEAPDAAAERLLAVRQRMAHQVMRADRWPLFEIAASRLPAGRLRLHVSFDLLIVDEWSLRILLDELARIYTDPAAVLPPLELSFRDYVLAEEALRGSAPYLRALEHWRQRLPELPPAPELPLAKSPSAVARPRFERRRRRFAAELWRRLQGRAAEAELTPSGLLLAAFAEVLATWSKSPRFLVNLTLFQRLPVHPQVDALVGDFTSLTLLAVDATERDGFEARARRLQRRLWEDLEHSRVSGVAVLRERAQREGRAAGAFAPVVFTSTLGLGVAQDSTTLPARLGEVVYSVSQTPQVWLDAQVREEAGDLVCYWDAVEELFPEGLLDAMFGAFCGLLERLAEDGEAWRDPELLLVPAADLTARAAVNDTAAPLPAGRLLDVLESAAAARRARPAVIAPGRTLTYGELRYAAHRLGGDLRRAGARPNRLVAVVMEKGWEQAVAVLGVLAAGAAYLPIDPALPAERLRLLLAEGEVELALTQPWLDGRLDWPAGVERRVVGPELLAGDDGCEPLAPVQAASDLAYVLFTSGSTGKPKGVMIDHLGALNTIVDINGRFAVGPEDRVLGLSALSFDLSVYDLFGPLAAGGALVLVEPAATRDPGRWAEWMARERVTVWNTVPALMEMLVEHLAARGERLPSALRLVLLSGDWIPLSLPGRVRALGADGIQVISLGGATEASIWSIFHPVGEVEPGWKSIPYGRPLTNQRFHVLDAALRPCPVWVPGELYIAGVGLAQGYWRDEAKSRASFFAHPRTGERLYRTGDWGRYLPGGEIEFLGRQDLQVKIRGHRIELGEIEAALARHPAVREAVAVVRDDPPGERRLVAYAVPVPGTEPAAGELREHLRSTLPEAMVPAAVVLLEALPLTANGKVDRRALPAPAAVDAPARDAGSDTSRTPVEELLAGMWADLLHLERVELDERFLELGGNSLLAMRLLSRIRRAFGVDVPLAGLFESPTVASLAAAVEAARRAGEAAPDIEPMAPIEPAARAGGIPLSFQQQRLWFLEQLAPGLASYHIPAAVRLSGPLDTSAFTRALGEIVRRHEVLRTTFPALDGHPVQLVAPVGGLELALLDLAALPAAGAEAEALRLAGEAALRPFDLARGPLVRVSLARLEETEHVALLTLHHMVSDGVSNEIFIRELAALYGAFQAGLPSPLEPLAVQYSDYAVWQSRRVPRIAERQLAFWRQHLAGAPPLLELPTDRPRPSVQGFRGGVRSMELAPELCAALRQLCRRESVTPFMALLTAFESLLWRLSGQPDLVVGVPVANRNRLEIEGLIGFFVNTLALRTRLAGGESFRELLERVREVTLQAHAHQELPFEKVVEELAPERHLGQHPLFQVMFTAQEDPRRLLELPGITLRRVPTEAVAAKLDLALFLIGTPEGWTASLEYRTDLFDAPTILRLLGHFATLLAAVAADPGQALARLPILDEAERHQLLVEWSDTAAPQPADLLVPHLFRARAEQDPGSLALVCGERRLTGGELAREAGRLARRLRGLGVGPEVRVGLCAERSPEMVVALLAILEAGGVYVPLDPAYPEARLGFMLADAEVAVLLTERRLADRLPEHCARLLFLDEPAAGEDGEPDAGAPGLRPDHLAYMIYTSGSTGRPKAVMVEHGSLGNMLLASRRELGWGADDRLPCVAPFSFDIFLFELLNPLLWGGVCELIPLRPALELERLLAALESATRFHAVPALMRQVVDAAGESPAAARAGRFGALRTLFVGGDRVPSDLLADMRRVFPGADLRVLYGPTEGTVICASHVVPDGDGSERTLIGRPLPNMALRLCDAALEPAPVGVTGEICIGGAGVSRGYWRRDELTAERYVTLDGARFYRTGDLARQRPDGTLEFLGRGDDQVKVRGFRIDLGEIEAVLREHPAVHDAVVEARESGARDRRLVAYVVPEARRQEGLELWPSTGEYFVYDELIYHGLTSDERRNQAYLRALAHAAKDKVVVDIGTGRDAILSRLCVEAGARRVYAIEIVEETYRHARRRIEELGLGDRVVLIHGDAARVELPEKVDVCVSEIVEAIGGAEGAAVILDAARRLLAEDGVMIPGRSVTRIAAVTLPDEVLDDPRFTEVSAHYVRRIFEQVGHPFDLRLCVKSFPASALLSDTGIFEDLVFDGPVAAEYDRELTLTVERAGRLDGFLLWLHLHLAEGEVIDILEQPYSWFPVYFPVFFPGVRVEAGDRLRLVCRARLSDNGVNPDYFLEGELVRGAGELIGFAFESLHHSPRHRSTPFYDFLFRDGEVPVRAAAPASGLARLLREHLAARLPEFMVPAALVQLDSLPLTPNGKVDRRALPDPDAARVGTGTAFAPPVTPVEEGIAGIWAEVLGVPRVGLHDNFFELGGHSLLATQVCSRIRRSFGVELPLRRLFELPTVARLAAAVEAGGESSRLPAIERAAREGHAPLSFSQERLWFLDRLAPGSAAYNVPGALALSGRLHTGALERCLAEIVRRHESLRTSISMLDGRPVQVVAEAEAWILPLVDLGALPAPRRAAEAQQILNEEAWRPFDLATGPLLRTLLVRRDAEAHEVLVVTHHIISDGWSAGVLVRELAALYRWLLEGGPAPLPELPVQYADYALWQRRWLQGARLEEQLGYWRRQLDGAAPVLELPTDRPRPAQQTSRGALEPLALPPALVAALQSLSREEGATLFMVVLAAFQALLLRYSGQDGFCVGSPVAGRNRLETEGLIGFFANTLVLRADLSGPPAFSTLLARTRDVTLAAYAHQEVPLERLIEELRPERHLSHAPLFQVMFAFQGAARETLELPGLSVARRELAHTTAKLDLSLLLEGDEAPAGGLEYSTDLFDAATIRRWGDHLLRLLAAAAATPELPVMELPLLSAAETHQLFVEWNATATAATHAAAATIPELVAAQAARTPDAVAVVDGELRLSYGELCRRAGRWARHLRHLGVGPEARVGVCTERTADMVVALLAVLQAGAAYVPLDPAYPAERLALTLADARVAVLLLGGSAALPAPAAGGPAILRLDGGLPEDREDAAPPSAVPGNLAYLIYTSGSTGRPKGVAIEHRSAAVLLRWAAEEFVAEELEGVLASTSICFDLSVFELFVPLTRGGKVILAGNALGLPGLPAAPEVTLVNTVPSAIAELVRSGGLPSGLRVVNLAGEPLQRALVDRLHAAGRFRVLNLYGPSEDTTYSTYATMDRESPLAPSIGRPVAGTRVYLLDHDLRPVPPGAPGELCLGGAGLARGYFDRPDLTAERFVPDPLHGEPGARLYRTGDLARHRADGALEFLGRRDAQVKVRGFRLELGEVEAALIRHPAVHEAVALAPEDGEGGRRLVAYVVPAAGEAPTAGELRAFLGRTLPDFMLPSVFVTLAALPLTPNGKVDRRALPLPGQEPHRAAGVPPTASPHEEVLAGIWAEVLGLPAVGIDDDFFDLGGHSLLATRVMARVHETLGIDLPLRSLFQFTTVRQLAEEVGRVEGAAGRVPDIERVARDGASLPLSFAQERLWFFDRLEPGSAAYNMSGVFRLGGELDAAALGQAFGEIVRRHEALRTVFPDLGQTVLPSSPVALRVVDMVAEDGAERERDALELAAAEALQPFDLADGPLVRTLLLRLANDEHLLVVTLHHIVCDGWSIGVFVRELATLYGAFRRGCRGDASPLPELPIQYADFAHWQRQWLRGAVLEDHLAYWTRHLEGAPALLELPTDRPRPEVQSYRGAGRGFLLPPALAAELQALSRGAGVTLFMTFLAAFSILLQRQSGQSDIVVGSNVANRHRRSLEGLIGLLANTVALRVSLAGEPTLRDLLAHVREVVLGAYAHQDLPFDRVVEALRIERSAAYSPLFQVMLVLQEPVLAGARLEGLTLSPVEIDTRLAKFDLTLFLLEEPDGHCPGGIRGQLEYNADLFEPATIDQFVEQLTLLLSAMPAQVDEPISALRLLGAGDERDLLVGFADEIDD